MGVVPRIQLLTWRLKITSATAPFEARKTRLSGRDTRIADIA